MVRVQRLPKPLVERNNVKALNLRQVKNVVLDEISRQKRRAAVIECLEYDLGVVAGLEIDDDKLEIALQRRRKR